MSDSEEFEPGIEPEPRPPGWREKLWAIGAASGRALETRAAMFQEELAEKGTLFGKGLASLLVAALFGTLAGLLLTALLAAVFSRLLGSPILGILATLILYLGVAAAAGVLGVRQLSRVRPLDFPVTRREIDRDLEAVKRAAGVGPDETGAGQTRVRFDGPIPARAAETPEEIERRLRESAG
jgi:membrane protein implicated in regulation of membrane protease activity